MGHPSSSDGDDGSRQTKSLKAWRHFASDRVADEKLMERRFLNLRENRNASKARAFRRKVDEHTDQSLVDYLATQVRVNGACGERTRILSRNLENGWMNGIRPSRRENSTSTTYPHKLKESGENPPGDEVQQTAAVVPGTVDRVKETHPGSVSLELSPTTLVVQDKGTNRSEKKGVGSLPSR